MKLKPGHTAVCGYHGCGEVKLIKQKRIIAKHHSPLTGITVEAYADEYVTSCSCKTSEWMVFDLEKDDYVEEEYWWEQLNYSSQEESYIREIIMGL